MSFTHYHCANGFAKPVNPFDYDSTVEYTAYERFAIFAKENTVSCSEDLSGEYKVELFKPIVWQSRLRGAIKWNNVLPEAYERSNNDFNHYREYCDNMCAFARQYIELKPVEKQSFNTIDHEEDQQAYYEILGRRFDDPNYAKQPEVKQPEVKQQGVEWIEKAQSIIDELKNVRSQNRSSIKAYSAFTYAIELLKKSINPSPPKSI